MYPRVEGAPNRVLTVYPRAAAQKVFSSLHTPGATTPKRRRSITVVVAVPSRRTYTHTHTHIYILTRNAGGGRDFST